MAALSKAKAAGSLEIMDKEGSQDKSLRLALLDSSENNNMFKRMIGEGDYDFTVRKRLETGLIAIAAQEGHAAPPNTLNSTLKVENTIQKAEQPSENTPRKFMKPASYTLSGPQDWAIQIGAFTSRERTDRALTKSLESLPTHLKHAYATIAPLKTDQGWIFRARLNGFTHSNAQKACAILSDCITIPPQNTYQ
jgi:hypothetical protein